MAKWSFEFVGGLLYFCPESTKRGSTVNSNTMLVNWMAIWQTCMSITLSVYIHHSEHTPIKKIQRRVTLFFFYYIIAKTVLFLKQLSQQHCYRHTDQFTVSMVKILCMVLIASGMQKTLVVLGVEICHHNGPGIIIKLQTKKTLWLQSNDPDFFLRVAFRYMDNNNASYFIAIGFSTLHNHTALGVNLPGQNCDYDVQLLLSTKLTR